MTALLVAATAGVAGNSGPVRLTGARAAVAHLRPHPVPSTSAPLAPAPTTTRPTPTTTVPPTTTTSRPRVPTTTAPAPAPTTTVPAPAPAPAVATASVETGYGCGPALAYLSANAAPGFTFECPGWSDGHQAMTCINTPGVCTGQKLIAIAVPCPAAYMNEASNSWVLEGLRSDPIDPYGYCH